MRLSATASEHSIESHKVPDYRLVYAFKNNKSSVCGPACTPCDLHRHYTTSQAQCTVRASKIFYWNYVQPNDNGLYVLPHINLQIYFLTRRDSWYSAIIYPEMFNFPKMILGPWKSPGIVIQKLSKIVISFIRDDVKLAQFVRARDCQSRGRRFVSKKTQKTENSNLHGFEVHRPSSKGTKLLFQVIKAIINQF